jgi:hypothetical protein
LLKPLLLERFKPVGLRSLPSTSWSLAGVAVAAMVQVVVQAVIGRL